MSAIKGRPAVRTPAALSSVESIKSWSPAGWDSGFYAVDVRVRVAAGSPAEAALHVQATLLGEETTHG
jgi:hypothetical protein